MIKLIDILNEYKINSPTTNFYFVDNGDETYYLDNRLRQTYTGHGGMGDEYVSFTFPGGDFEYEFMPSTDNPLEFIEIIELNMEEGDLRALDITFLKAFVSNMVNAKIPIAELDFSKDGGWRYLDLVLSYKDITKYIIPLDRAPDWFKPDY